MDNDNFSCPMCRKKNIESSITTYRDINHRIKKITEKDIKKFLREHENDNNNTFFNSQENKLSYELKAIDKYFFDTRFIFDQKPLNK